MTGKWTVRDVYPPFSKPGGPEPALLDGNPFSFRFGEELERDDEKTVSEEKNGVIIRQWFWLKIDRREGFAPHNPLDPKDIRSPVIELSPGTPPPFRFEFFDGQIDREAFVENCVRKAIRWQANAAYLFALGFIESGTDWPPGRVNSPEAKPGITPVGTFQFPPETWRTLVDKLGADQSIDAEDIVFPEAQTTFAASQAGDAAVELETNLGRKPSYLDLYLAHLLTNEGCVHLNKLGEDDRARPFADVLTSIVFSKADDQTRLSRVTSLIQRKKNLLEPGGQSLSVTDALAALAGELDRGFKEARTVGAALVPPQRGSRDSVSRDSVGSDTLGVLSEEFESRGNPAAIGRDRVGGWSYGKYQISTNRGRFAEFMASLESKFPALAGPLIAAGGAHAAAAGAEPFQFAWRSLKSAPDFVTAQHEYIKTSHYDVIVNRLKAIIDVGSRSAAIQNVVWSVAVQHGPFSKIIEIALKRIQDITDDAALINEVYDERSKVNIYFANSTPSVRAAVLNRFRQERRVALQML
ncbi:hypothetical protein GVN24_16105 [Rhizobium sp. CRIBSB]|nr:hypothetical protein [Rhizobium sp. CRIBSB]